MSRALIIFAVLLGVALAEDERSMQEQAEGRLFFAGFPLLGALISLGVQIVILLALINFVTSLKGSIDFDNLFGKGGDDYGYTGYAGDTGYAAPATGYAAAPATGYAAPAGDAGSSYSSYRRQGTVNARSFNDSPVMQKLSAKVVNAIENFKE